MTNQKTPESFHWGEVEARGPKKRVEVFMLDKPQNFDWTAHLPKTRERRLTGDHLQQIGCPKKYIPLILSLNTPREVQRYIRQDFQYDHSENMPTLPALIEGGLINCFTGAFGLAYPLLYLHGHQTWIEMLVADNARDENHNIVVYRDKNTGKLGSIAMSSWDTLMDRPNSKHGGIAKEFFDSVPDLVLDYWNAYTSAYEKTYKDEHTLIGFSDPINVAENWGLDYIFEPGKESKKLRTIFNTYTRGLLCSYLFNPRIRFVYPEERNYRIRNR